MTSQREWSDIFRSASQNLVECRRKKMRKAAAQQWQMGIPAAVLIEKIRKGPCPVYFLDDNQAMIRICHNGHSKTIRHIGRTHRVDIAFLHECFTDDEQYKLVYVDTFDQAADIFTKAFSNADKWNHACQLILHVIPDQFWGKPPAVQGGGNDSKVPSEDQSMPPDSPAEDLQSNGDIELKRVQDQFRSMTVVMEVSWQQGIRVKSATNERIQTYEE